MDKINIRSDKYVPLSSHSIYIEIYKKVMQKQEIWNIISNKNEEFELPDGSYSISDIQDHFDIKNMRQLLNICKKYMSIK